MNSESILKISTNQKLKNPVELSENYSSTYVIVGRPRDDVATVKKSSLCCVNLPFTACFQQSAAHTWCAWYHFTIYKGLQLQQGIENIS
jgi:hypothetical protein